MYLRSGRWLQKEFATGADQESLVSTNESVNQAGIDPLEPIIEEGSETDTSSEQSIYIMATQQAEMNQTNMAAEGTTSQSMYVNKRECKPGRD